MSNRLNSLRTGWGFLPCTGEPCTECEVWLTYYSQYKKAERQYTAIYRFRKPIRASFPCTIEASNRPFLIHIAILIKFCIFRSIFYWEQLVKWLSHTHPVPCSYQGSPVHANSKEWMTPEFKRIDTLFHMQIYWVISIPDVF